MMIVTCAGCSKRYKFDEAKLQGRPSVSLTCPNCQASITVSAADPGDRTSRLEVDALQISRAEKVPLGSLAMPARRRLSLAVLEGQDSGHIYSIDRPRTIIGRGEADIVINDSEISRQHAAIEVQGPRVVVKDLGSTNGVFVNDVKVSQAEIENRAEFRLGATRLMLIIAEQESDPEGQG
jgi:hypothetical protein